MAVVKPSDLIGADNVMFHKAHITKECWFCDEPLIVTDTDPAIMWHGMGGVMYMHVSCTAHLCHGLNMDLAKVLRESESLT